MIDCEWMKRFGTGSRRGAVAAVLLLAIAPALLPAAPADDLRALEARRIAAINAQDAQALKPLLADDYVHVHATGKVDTREGFIQNVVGSKRISERGPLTIRNYGDKVAVVTGEQVNRTTGPDGVPHAQRLMVTQVAVRDGKAWKYVSMQATPIADSATKQ